MLTGAASSRHCRCGSTAPAAWSTRRSPEPIKTPPAEKGPEFNDLGRSRGEFSTKIHAAVDAKGRPLHVELTPGQQHESTVANSLIERAQGRAFIGDTACDSKQIRQTVEARGMKPVIPSNPTRSVIHRYDKKLYAIRYRIECFFHRIKRCRRIATRFEKTGRNSLALIHLAASLVWLRAI